MGNCPSSFRAQFTPNQGNGTTDIIIAPDKAPSDGEKQPASKLEQETAPEDRNLVVKSVDLCVTENASHHHTGEYFAVRSPKPKLVIRRGFPFNIKVTLDRNYNRDKDAICLVFAVKDSTMPTYAQNTLVIIPVISSEGPTVASDAWQAKIVAKSDTTLNIEVVPSTKAIIGEWMMEIDTKLQKCPEEKSLRYTMKDSFYLLFNPWCTKDTVYMAHPDERKEYIMNESGLIWRGNFKKLRPSAWCFGQFEENVLAASIYLLAHLGKLSIVNRSDPVRVVRHISAVVSTGVIVNSTTGDYKGGQSPMSWTGSEAILQKFYSTKKPVRFGQCWVTSGVTTTICRALGIPARSVTNFSSAHDTHNSLTIDMFFDKDGKPVDSLNIDSLWTFHAWNEVWMERPDLEPGGYGGWQAVDPTPQEESDGLYRCGPASVAAIRRGEVLKSYDTPLIFSEVNAHKVYWKYDGPNKPLKLLQKSTERIGQSISTKSIGKFEREDITCDYKHVGHNKDEREAMLRSLVQCKNSFSRYCTNNNMEDIEFTLSIDEDIMIGSPFSIRLKAANKRTESTEYTIRVLLRVDTMYYTGRLKKMIKKDDFEIKLAGNTEQEMTMSVNYVDYEKVLADQGDFSVVALAHVLETGYDYIAQDIFTLKLPTITVEVQEDVVQGQPFLVNAFFKNPLQRALKNGIFTVEGAGLGKSSIIKFKGAVIPETEAKITARLIPKSAGEKVIIVKFRSTQLDDIEGHLVIRVKPPLDSTDKDMNSHL